MRVTIHQPEFAPWLGFFHKASLADTVILLDDVQFRKNYFQNRNRIRLANGPSWITVPVKNSGLNTPINEIEIAWDAKPEWASGVLDKIKQTYIKAPFFKTVFAELSAHFTNQPRRLVDLNIPVIQWMAKFFGIQASFTLSSTMGVTGTSSERILELCKKSKATTYVSGISGKDYLDLESFRAAGIVVEFQNFHHPIYEQLQPEFLPQISGIEALLLFGMEASCLIREDWPQKLETVFA